MQVNKEMEEENQTMVEWEEQRKKDLVPRKNKKKHAWAPSVNATTMIYYCEKFYEIKTGITKQ